MIVYIKAKTRVKGNTKDVFYIGTVQDDGYIYFNDEKMYRMPTPPNMQGGMSYLTDHIQVWYVVRNCWIRANYFTNMSIIPLDLEQIAQLEARVSSLETNFQNLTNIVQRHGNNISSLLSYINELGHESIGDDPNYGYGNGDNLLELWNAVSQLIIDTGSSASLPSRSIFIQWLDKSL